MEVEVEVTTILLLGQWVVRTVTEVRGGETNLPSAKFGPSVLDVPTPVFVPTTSLVPDGDESPTVREPPIPLAVGMLEIPES